jgi:hypothetical protein
MATFSLICGTAKSTVIAANNAITNSAKAAIEYYIHYRYQTGQQNLKQKQYKLCVEL